MPDKTPEEKVTELEAELANKNEELRLLKLTEKQEFVERLKNHRKSLDETISKLEAEE